MEALRQEQSEVEERQTELIRQREAQLEAEKEQREALALQLQETKVQTLCHTSNKVLWTLLHSIHLWLFTNYMCMVCVTDIFTHAKRYMNFAAYV